MKKKNITIEDVARQACVSRQTVSRVLNQSDKVARKTYHRIMKAINKLQYTPDPVARSLASRRTYTIGILTSAFSGYIYARTLEGAEEYARQHGFQIFISGSKHSDYGEPLESHLLKRQKLEGLMINYHGAKTDSFQIFNDIPANIPIVTTGYAKKRDRVLSITIDNRKAAYNVTKHLIDHGHKSIANITGPKYSFETINRNKGYIKALKEAGIAVDSNLMPEGDWGIKSGYLSTKALLSSNKKITAIFAQSDRMAIGVIKALEDNGIQVPEDIAVCGFNNLPLTEFLKPALSTVHNPAFKLGMLSVKALINMINEKKGLKNILSREELRQLEPKMVPRDSC